jgi:tyrosinase
MRKMYVRKNQSSLSAPEKQKFVKAVLDLKAETRPGHTLNSYDQFVQWHKDTVDEATGREDAHMGPAFFAWHRVFLRVFDAYLQGISGDRDLSVPYWDWTVDNSPTSSIWADTFMGGNGNGAPDWAVTTGPFRRGNWELRVRGTDPDTGKEEPAYLRRQFGANNLKLPTQKDVQDTLSATPFDVDPWNDKSASGFRNRAEGYIPKAGRPHMHNAVHNWVGGSMIPITSPNDPVFFLHHCFMDKLWADWQTLHPNEKRYLPTDGARQGHNLNDSMNVMGDPPAGVLNHHSSTLAYRYDTDP